MAVSRLIRTLATQFRQAPMLWLALWACVGVVVDRTGKWSVGGVAIVGALALFSWLIAIRMKVLTVAVICLSLAFGAFFAIRHHICWNWILETDVRNYATSTDQPARVEGVVVGRITKRPATLPHASDTSRFRLRLTRLRKDQGWCPVQGTVQVVVAGDVLGVAAGDRLEIVGKMSSWQVPGNPGQFDYQEHCRADGIYARLFASDPGCVVRVDGGSFEDSLARRREDVCRRARDALWSHLHPDRRPLAAAILLGQIDNVDRDIVGRFQQTGTIHLLVISGLHLGILAAVVYWLARVVCLPRGFSFLGVALLMLMYVWVTGGRPPVMRAAILVWLACLAGWCWRPASLLNGLASAAIVILLINPADLFRVGPQLSFLAVVTILCLNATLFQPRQLDPLQRLLLSARPWYALMFTSIMRSLGQITVLGATIWLVALPLVMYHFHLLTPGSVIINPLLTVPMTAALMSGFATMMMDCLGIPGVGICGACCDMSLAAMMSLVDRMHAIQSSFMWVAGPCGWWVVGWYAILVSAVACWRLPGWRIASLAVLSTWLVIGGIENYARSVLPADSMSCTFIQVGHGTAVLVEMPAGQKLLYDAGCLGAPYRASDAITAVLWQRGITKLDAVIVSHDDADHYNGIPLLLERIAIGELYVSRSMLDDPSAPVEAMFGNLAHRDVPVRALASTSPPSREWSDTIGVLQPGHERIAGSDNANSIVLHLKSAGGTVLLPGDLEGVGLQTLLARPKLKCDVLLAPHHGSPRSDPHGLAAWCRPNWVIVSGKHHSSSEVVEDAYQRSGCRLLHTAEEGAVRVELRADGIQVWSWGRGGWRRQEGG